MTPKERFLTAVRMGTPDQVPVAPLIHLRYAHRRLGRAGWKAVFDVHQELGSICFRGPQGVGFTVDWPQGWGEEERLLEEHNGRRVYEQTLRTPHGCLHGRRVVGMIPADPLVGRQVEHYVKQPGDWRIFRAYWEKWLERAKPNLQSITEIHRVMGEEGIASVGMGCVFARLGQARGMQALLYDLYDCPDLLQEVSATLRQVVERQVRAFLDSPAEVLWYDVCWATGARMSPEFFATWALPDLQQVAELVRTRPGKYVGFYTLGKIRALLPLMVETQPHFIETFEPNEGDITLREAKEKYGDRICLMGNYDCVILARGTREQAREETLRCLREGMEGGGYVLVTGDEVPADAKWENLQIMVETAAEYGRY